MFPISADLMESSMDIIYIERTQYNCTFSFHPEIWHFSPLEVKLVVVHSFSGWTFNSALISHQSAQFWLPQAIERVMMLMVATVNILMDRSQILLDAKRTSLEWCCWEGMQYDSQSTYLGSMCPRRAQVLSGTQTYFSLGREKTSSCTSPRNGRDNTIFPEWREEVWCICV